MNPIIVRTTPAIGGMSLVIRLWPDADDSVEPRRLGIFTSDDEINLHHLVIEWTDNPALSLRGGWLVLPADRSTLETVAVRVRIARDERRAMFVCVVQELGIVDRIADLETGPRTDENRPEHDAGQSPSRRTQTRRPT